MTWVGPRRLIGGTERRTRPNAGKVTAVTVRLNDRLTLALRTWAKRTPDRLHAHYVFPLEQYGQPGENHRHL